jgi:hypothetical protein
LTSAFFCISQLDPAQEYVDTGTCFSGNRKNLVQLQPFFQSKQIPRALVAAQAIDLGGDDGEAASSMAEPIDELFISRLRGDVRVDEADAKAECLAILEIRLDEGRPSCGDGFRNLRIAVARQVGEDSSRALALVQQGKEIDRAGAARRRRDLGSFVADKRVQQARFAYIGSAEKSNLRHRGNWELRSRKGGEQELSGIAHSGQEYGNLTAEPPVHCQLRPAARR